MQSQLEARSGLLWLLGAKVMGNRGVCAVTVSVKSHLNTCSRPLRVAKPFLPKKGGEESPAGI